MLSITDLERLFKRYLKERGEWHKARNTNIIERFLARMKDDNRLSSFGTVTYRLNKGSGPLKYPLADFYRFMYKSDGGAFLEEIAEIYDKFLRGQGLDAMFLDEVNNMFSHTYGKVYASKCIVSEHGISAFYIEADHVDDIKSYVYAKTMHHPASLYRHGFPWSFAKTKYPKHNDVAASWTAYIIRQMKNEDEKRKN